LLNRGYLPSTLIASHGSWFDFAATEGDLSNEEARALEHAREWLSMVESTSLNKSFKLVVIRVLLDRDAMWTGLELLPLAEACRRFLLSHEVLRNDLAPNQLFADHAQAALESWANWWKQWPLAHLEKSQTAKQGLAWKGTRFAITFTCGPTLRTAIESMTSELVDYRLARYARRFSSEAPDEAARGFAAKVSHSSGNPILRIPRGEDQPGRPVGPTDVTLPDGTVWTFRFVKIACNVAAPVGVPGNQLPDLMRTWFGADAGAPGTDFHVQFERTESGWTAVPRDPRGGTNPEANVVPFVLPAQDLPPGFRQTVSSRSQFISWAPVYSLQAAAGLWGPEQTPEPIGWARVPGQRLGEDMFIAQVRGRSMEPRIQDGSWCLFRKCSAGSREGRIVLVQFRSQTDPELGSRHTVKRYHSVKQPQDGSWQHQSIQLQPLNPEFPPINVTAEEAAEMRVVADFIRQL
jgi:SOS-response transcriptional repressor LexA